MSRKRRNKIQREIKEVLIEKFSHDGRGIALVDEKVVFVAGALVGETVRIKYLKSKRSFDEAIAVEIINKSEDRIEPKCPYFMRCGGCTLQHLSPISQIKFKQEYLFGQFQKLANYLPIETIPAITGGVWEYRHKARLGVRVVNKKGGALVGFRESGSGFLTVMDSCEVLHPKVGRKIDALRTLINKMTIGNKIAQIEMAMGDKDCVLIFRNLIDLPKEDKKLLDEFGLNNQLYIYVQSAGLETIKPLNDNHFVQLSYKVNQLNFEFSPHNFTQVNFDINQKMVNQAMDLLNIQQDEAVLDLFCGLGNFSLSMALKAKTVLGLEGSQSLVDDAYHNAKLNKINNIEFAVLDLQTESFQGVWLSKKWDKILLDPPRSGALEMMPVLAKIKPERIVYVSCNPVTLARDASILINKFGYKCQKIGVMDMFPHTAHVESMALFVK